MKPCAENRKTIAWLLLGELPEPEAKTLRGHLALCRGCRGYADELSKVCDHLTQAREDSGEIQPSDSFHQELMGRIRTATTTEHPAASLVQQWKWAWRAAALGGAAALCLFLVSGPHRSEEKVNRREALQPLRPPVHSLPTEHASLSESSPPSYSYYRTAANVSLEHLDALLAEGISGGSPSPETFRAGDHRLHLAGP